MVLVAGALCAAATCVPVFAQGFGGTVEDTLVRADALLAQQRANEAIVQYQEARTLCPTPAQIVASLQGEARAHMMIKEYLPAAGLLEEAAQRFPDDPRLADILYLAGLARREGGDVAGAVPLLQKAMEHNPTPDLVPAMKYQLAQALRMSGRPNEVIPLLKDFETEYDKSPLIPNVLYVLAISQHDSRDLAGAEATYRHLIETYPHTQATLEAFYDLADVLAARGNRKDAEEYFRRFANGNPNSPVAARSLERAADMNLFVSPKTAAILYGVARVKAQQNPVPPAEDLQISRYLGAKLWLADMLSRTPVLIGVGVVAVLALAGIAWGVSRRFRAARA
jgi:tetratricopeptide (TPR) repeat protein